MFKLNRRQMIAATAAVVVAGPVIAESHGGTVHEVEMLNQNPDNPRQRMVFSPRVLVVQPGDTVKFLPTDRGHNSQSIDDMIPTGTEGWEGAINGEVEVTFDTPGFYGYQCKPHQTVGMVAAIIVAGEGALDNLEDAKGVRQRGQAKKVWAEIFDEIDALEL